MNIGTDDPLYCSQQIIVPLNLPYILKQYAKAAIRTQPIDLLHWSAVYFRALAKGEVPPAKDRIEYPPIQTLSGLSPGFLKVLIKQLGKHGFIHEDTVTEKWLGLGLKEDHLQTIFKLCTARHEKIRWGNFVAVAAGYLAPTLTQTMILICELLTEDPDGGPATIPFDRFLTTYKFLARLNCGPIIEVLEDHGEELVQVVETRPPSLSSVATEGGPNLSDLKDGLEKLPDDIERHDSNAGLMVWEDVEYPKPPKQQSRGPSEEGVTSDVGLTVLDDSLQQDVTPGYVEHKSSFKVQDSKSGEVATERVGSQKEATDLGQAQSEEDIEEEEIKDTELPLNESAGTLDLLPTEEKDAHIEEGVEEEQKGGDHEDEIVNEGVTEEDQGKVHSGISIITGELEEPQPKTKPVKYVPKSSSIKRSMTGELVEILIEYETTELQPYEIKHPVDEEGFPLPKSHSQEEVVTTRLRGYSLIPSGEGGSEIVKTKKKKKKKIYNISEEGNLIGIEEIEIADGDEEPDPLETADLLNVKDYPKSDSDSSVEIDVNLVPLPSYMVLKDDEEWAEVEVEEDYVDVDSTMMTEKLLTKRFTRIFKRKKKYPLGFKKYEYRLREKDDIGPEGLAVEAAEESVSAPSVDELYGKDKKDALFGGIFKLHPTRNESLSLTSIPESFEPPIAHVPGIGPILDEQQIQDVEQYLRKQADKQAGFIMPRNIRHFLCPPLDLETSKPYPDPLPCKSTSGVFETENNPIVEYCCVAGDKQQESEISSKSFSDETDLSVHEEGSTLLSKGSSFGSHNSYEQMAHKPQEKFQLQSEDVYEDNVMYDQTLQEQTMFSETNTAAPGLFDPSGSFTSKDSIEPKGLFGSIGSITSEGSYEPKGPSGSVGSIASKGSTQPRAPSDQGPLPDNGEETIITGRESQTKGNLSDEYLENDSNVRVSSQEKVVEPENNLDKSETQIGE